MSMIKAVVKDLMTKMYKLILSSFFIFPIKNNRVFFESFSGEQYSCNPKYICEELEKSSNSYELVWAFKDPQKFRDLINSKVHVVRYGSIQYWYYRMTARVTITNTNYRNYSPIRKKQYEIQTWHGGGGGYKKTMTDDKEFRKDRFAAKRTVGDIRRYSLMLTSSETSLKNNVRSALQYKGTVLCGTARNDILINRDRSFLYDKVKKYFNLPPEVKIALYAPTWRLNTTKEDFDIDYELLKKALKKRFGCEWVILSRMHRLAARFFTAESEACISAESYPDMQELLYAVDVLISDYSSSIWDYSFTGKPCFLFCTDLNKYNKDRDFYNPISTWGFPLAQNNEELVNNVISFDDQKFCKAMHEQHEKNGSFENGHTSENVCMIIEAMCYGNGRLPEGLPYR